MVGASRERLAADYDVLDGGLLPFVLVLPPWIAGKVRGGNGPSSPPWNPSPTWPIPLFYRTEVDCHTGGGRPCGDGRSKTPLASGGREAKNSPQMNHVAGEEPSRFFLQSGLKESITRSRAFSSALVVATIQFH